MTRQRWLVGIVVAGLAWRLYLVRPVTHWDSTVLALGLGATPYAVVSGFAWLLGARGPLLASAALALSVDVVCGVLTMRTSSSTGAVAVMLAPLVTAFVGVLVGTVGLAAQAKAQRKALRASETPASVVDRKKY